MRVLFIIGSLLYFSFTINAQENAVEKTKDSIVEVDWSLAVTKPSKVAFYSAILPGLGQAYNKKYWKIPIVYGALATSTYYFIYNDNKYQEYRSLFRLKKLDEDATDLSFDVLQRAQVYHKKNRDGAMLLTIAAYVLQIVEASVDAHLQYHSTDKILTFKPQIIKEPISGHTGLAAGFTLKF